MSEVIKEWITNSIGVVMNMTPKVFAAEVMDGTIIARILQNYNIINEDQRLLVMPTNDPAMAYKNLQYIRPWLKSINVDCSEEDVAEIANETCSTSLKLFYRIYLILHDKDVLHYAAQRRGNERLHPTDTRFEVTSVNETSNEDFSTLTKNPYTEPLVLKRGVIEWCKSQEDTFKKKSEAMRKKKIRTLEEKLENNKLKFNKVAKNNATTIDSDLLEELNKRDSMDTTYTNKELMELSERAKFGPDPKVAAEIVNKLKKKHKEERRANEAKVQQQRLLLMDLWNKLLTEQEKELDECITTKVLKQSVFEKQMTAKMFEVRQQKDNIIKNRKCVEEEQLKKREEEYLNSVFLRDKGIVDQKYNFAFEYARRLELHKRIFAERQRLEKVRRTKMCADAVSDLVDLSLKYYVYKDMHKTEPDRQVMNEWGHLFTKSKSVFPYMEDLSDIVVHVEPQDGMESIFCAEIDRQEGLDQGDLENYLNYEWPWELSELLSNYEDILTSIELGMNVLGDKVHRVLYAKYPRPEEPPKSEIPTVNVAVCVNGLPNTNVLPVLQKLLRNRRVKVIEMQDAINCCLNAFHEESKTEKIDENLISITETTVKKLDKKTKPEVPKKGAKGAKPVSPVEEVDMNSKETSTQTPLIYPCEEIVLSRKANLGKTAYDLLNLGEELTDNLVIAMFIEYLKTFKQLNGWALINYPTTLAQAVILEEALTGLEIPNVSDAIKLELSLSIGDISDLEFREPQMDAEEINSNLRKSYLVPNPSKISEKQSYKTYLTALVQVKHESVKEQEDAEEFIESPLDKFYFEQGCNYALYYEKFEFAQVKRLAKMILGEYSIPPKTSCELFGDTVLYLETTLGLPKKELARKSKSTSEVEIELINQEPEMQEELPTVFQEPKAGEKYWHYIELLLPEEFAISLGTFWENLELVYTNDFKQLFFYKRVAINSIMPYLSHVRDHMSVFLTRPDNKQYYLHNFQKYYNEISPDMRDDAEIKAEIHCTIAEFREKLWELCDSRMNECEVERQEIINDNWLPTVMIEFINVSIWAMQLELDRSCDTFQFITDYYCGLVTKLPSKNQPLQKIKLSIVTEERSASLVNEFKSVTTTILTVMESSTANTPFHTIIERTWDTSQTTLSKYRSAANAALTSTESFLKPKPGKQDAGKHEKNTQQKDTKLQAPTLLEPNDEVKAVASKLIEEWQSCLLGEYQRARLRLNIIKERSLRDVASILTSCQKSFHTVFNDIRTRYESETASVNLACEVLARAVEAEVPIQPQLVLDDGKFYVEPNILLFPEPPPKPEPPLEEQKIEGIFTINQLEEFSAILARVAPLGSIPERAFVYILQDLIVQNAEDGKEPMVPILWQNLTPQQVNQLSKRLFGDVEFIDWKDFIIYNMQLPYPTSEQLLEIRTQFFGEDPDPTGMVKDDQFFSVNFWFEDSFNLDDSQESFRLSLIKKLLFKLYKINESTFNCTAFLLDFCKGDKITDGFAKALSLFSGKKICENEVVGEMYVSSIKEQRFLDERVELLKRLEHEDTVKCAQSVLSTLATKAVHDCESVIIESYHSINELDNVQTVEEPPIPEDQEVTRDELLQPVEEEGSALLDLKDIYTNESVETGSGTQSEEFSNVEIGFEPYYYSDYIYLLRFEAVLSVLTVALPWHAKTQTIFGKSVRERFEAIYEKLKDPFFNNLVLVHVLMKDQDFNELLSHFFKFIDMNPPKIVQMLLEHKQEV